MAQRHMGLSAPLAMQVALAEFIASGAYLAQVRRMTRLYRTRRDRLVQALASETRGRLMVDVPAGSMQLLARCGASSNDRTLASRRATEGIVTQPVSPMNLHAVPT